MRARRITRKPTGGRLAPSLGAALTLGALAFGAVTLGAVTATASARAEVIHPLPRSSYAIRAACTQPAAGRAGCLALALVPRTQQARAHTHPLGISRNGPIPTSPAAAQTIALVDAYNDPTAEADLKAYSEEFGLPACTAANGCFKQVNQDGHAGPLPFPASTAELEAARKGTLAQREEAEEATGWGVEISLDIEAARAVCQSCHILLVEADSPSFGDLETAEASAEALGAQEISNSWGGAEHGLTASLEAGSAFNHPGTVITASSGDYGYLNWGSESPSQRGYANFPASSPHVVAVGGTRLSLGVGGSYLSEAVWNGDGAGGGGCSAIFGAPSWQLASAGWSSVGCASERAVADVSADVDPYSGFAVHDSSPACETVYEEAKVKHVDHWCTVGGTSLSSPLVAGVYALAGGPGEVAYPARTLYAKGAAAGALNDVSSGSNGECATPSRNRPCCRRAASPKRLRAARRTRSASLAPATTARAASGRPGGSPPSHPRPAVKRNSKAAPNPTPKRPVARPGQRDPSPRRRRRSCACRPRRRPSPSRAGHRGSRHSASRWAPSSR